MWCWRRIEKIKCTDKITNKVVLRRVGEERTLLSTIIKKKKLDRTHFAKRVLHDVVESRTKGIRKKRMQMIDDFRKKSKYRQLKPKHRTRKHRSRRFEWRIYKSEQKM